MRIDGCSHNRREKAVPRPPLRPYFVAEFGGVAERLKAHAWKACVRLRVPWVRIPLPPPDLLYAPPYV